MGVERAVTRWYVRRQAIETEIAELQQRLNQSATLAQAPEDQKAPSVDESETQRQLLDARQRLQKLGPCPKAMMG